MMPPSWIRRWWDRTREKRRFWVETTVVVVLWVAAVESLLMG